MPNDPILMHHNPETSSHTVEPRLGKRLNIDPYLRRARFFEPESTQWWKKGAQPLRDSYKQRCYNAEGLFATKIEQRTFANITEVAKYVRSVMEKPWFQRRFPYFTRCHVEYRPRTTVCCGGPRTTTVEINRYEKEVRAGSIEMSTWGMGITKGRGGELVVLHELAHAVLPAFHSHDRRWLRTFVEFIGCVLGTDTRKVFMEILRDKHIPFSPIKKIKFTPEHMAKLAASRPTKKERQDD
jgi:putative metallohydrolase (TIGR04338 family)